MPSKETRERLVLTMEGPREHSGRPSVKVFASAVEALRKLMRGVAEQQMGREGKQMDFLIYELRFASPIVVGVIPDGTPTVAEQVVAAAEQSLLSVARGQTEDISALEYDAIEDISKPYKDKTLATTMIQRVNGAAVNEYPSVVIDSKYIDNLERGRARELCGATTVSGRVEGLNLHSNPIKLRIYPPIGGPVVWRLPKDAEKKALEVIGERVAVTGSARYRPDNKRRGIQRPYRIDAGPDRVEILGASEDNWNRIEEFRGAFPELTDGKESVAYVRELREARDKDD